MLKKLHLVAIFLLTLFALPVYAASAGALLHSGGDPVGGNPSGSVTVVEFFDYQCSHCISMSSVMNDITRSNSNVRVVYKEFPIRGAMSELAARAALAANRQGRYSAFSHALLNEGGLLTEESIYRIAADQGLNVDRLKKDMNSSSIKQTIANNYRLGKDLHLTGTPAFYIGPTNARSVDQLTFVLGEMSQSQLQQAIDNARK